MRHPGTQRGSTSRSSTTRPARTATARRRPRRSFAESSSSTCARTAGTTSATTSSSTSTAACSRAGRGESHGMSSARTPRASTPARWVWPSSATTPRPRSARRPSIRSRSCSPGASTSPMSTRSGWSAGSRAGTRNTRAARRCSCVRSPVTGTPDSRAARAPRSTGGCPISRTRSPRSGCRSCTRPSSTARSAAPFASARGSPLRPRGP